MGSSTHDSLGRAPRLEAWWACCLAGLTVSPTPALELDGMTELYRIVKVASDESGIVEVAVPHEEIAHGRTGQPAVVRLDAFPDAKWESALVRVPPRTEIREQKIVFIAEVTLDNSDGSLRLRRVVIWSSSRRRAGPRLITSSKTH